MSKQSGLSEIPKDLQFSFSECHMEIPDHIQGRDDIIAFVTGMLSPGKPLDVLRQSIAIYTKAYFSFLKTPDIVHGRCGAESEYESLPNVQLQLALLRLDRVLCSEFSAITHCCNPHAYSVWKLCMQISFVTEKNGTAFSARTQTLSRHPGLRSW